MQNSIQEMLLFLFQHDQNNTAFIFPSKENLNMADNLFDLVLDNIKYILISKNIEANIKYRIQRQLFKVA